MRRGILTICLGVISCLFVLCLAYADVVHLNSGGEVEGKIIVETDKAVKIATQYGIQTINRKDIKEVERTPSSREQYEKKKRSLPEHNAEAHYALGIWCKENGLETESELQFKKALQLDPDHRGARIELGYCLYGGRWVYKEQLKEVLEKGKLVVYQGELITEQEHQTIMEELEADKETEKEAEPTAEQEPATEPTTEKKEKGIPWEKAYKVRAGSFEIKTNCPRKVASHYRHLLSELEGEYKKLIRGFKPRSKEKLPVNIYKDQEDFIKNTGRSREVGAYYDSSAGLVASYHGTYGFREKTYNALAAQCTYQYLDALANDPKSIPGWLFHGTATYFESSEISDTGSLKTGKLPRDGLLQLQQMLKKGTYMKLSQLIRMAKANFSPAATAQSWALLYWLVEKRLAGKIFPKYLKPIFEQDSKTEGERPTRGDREGRAGGNRRTRPAPRTDPARIFEQLAGDMEKLESDWKEFILALEVPPAGKISGNRFTSERFSFEISKPSSYEFITAAEEPGFQIGCELRDAQALICVHSNRLKHSGSDYVKIMKSNLQRRYSNVELITKKIDSLDAFSLVCSDKDRRTELAKDEVVYTYRLTILVTEELIYLLRFKSYTVNYGSRGTDFDRIENSFKLTEKEIKKQKNK